MPELANENMGASILAASAYDQRHAADNVLDGDINTFWATTGAFPHEVIVQLGETSTINKIEMTSTNVRHLIMEVCTGPTGTVWEKVADMELDENDGRLQNEHKRVPSVAANFVKLVIKSGWDDHCTLHKISIEGSN